MANKRQKDYRIRNGKVYARITYTDEKGKRRDVMRLADSRAHAKELAAQMRSEMKDHGSRIVDADKLKFETLLGYYEEDRVKPAEYAEGHKVAGLRSVSSVKLMLRTLVAHFGRRLVKTVTPTDVEKFKAARLNTTAQRSKEKLTIATVNRELELLRAIFGYARREGWLVRSPFERLRGIISKADERRRDRVLSYDEEKRLLDACDDPHRQHLRPILICALDTAMRRGEILKLKWLDVDLTNGVIRLRATTTKTEQPRTVGMTARLHAELSRLWELGPQDWDASVFGISYTFKRAFASARKAAEITDLRFHDLRHTATTRIVETKALHTQEAMKITGHTQESTFARYVNPKDETARRGAEALDALRDQAQWDETPESESDLVN